MAGPTPMALGSYKFEAMGFGFSDLGRNLDTSWADVDVCARLDAMHWVGPKSDTVTIKGALFPAEFGGQDSLDGLRSAALSGRVLTLATMDGGVHGRFAIQGVEEERQHHTGEGTPRKNAYSIKLKRIEAGAGASLFAGVAALGSLF